MMGFWQILALAYAVVFIVILSMGATRPIRITLGGYALAGLFALSLALLAYHLQPGSALDLYRLQKNIDEMRYAAVGPLERLSVGQERFNGLISFQLMCWLISFLPDNGYLAFIAVLITFSMLLMVLINFLRREGYGSNALLPSIAVMFMGMQVQYVFSGVRNAMAVAMAVTGLYCVYYKRKHFIFAALMFAISVTMHPMTIVLLPVALFAGRKRQLPWRIAALVALPIAFAVSEIIVKVPLAPLQALGGRVLFYSTRSYPYDRPEMIANFAVFIVVGGGYYLLRKADYLAPETSGERKYLNAYYLLGFAMLGCAAHRDFALRFGYIMGIASVPLLLKILFRLKNGSNEKIIKFVPLAVRLVLAVCCAKVYYDTWVVMSQWQFV